MSTLPSIVDETPTITTYVLYFYGDGEESAFNTYIDDG